MERNDSRYEVDEITGKVRIVIDSPKSATYHDPRSVTISPSKALALFGGPQSDEDDTICDDNEFPENHSGMDEIVSIAQPLKPHGNVFKISGGSATLVTPSERREDSFQDGSAFPSEPCGVRTQSPTPQRKRAGLSNIHSFLCTVPHLSTLSMEQLTALKVMIREYDALDNVIEPNTVLQHCYVLAAGTVEVFDLRQQVRAVSHKRIASITAPNIFGMESLVFDRPSEFSYSASSGGTTILLISKAQFLELFRKNNMFSHSVGSRLTQSMPQFNVFQDFCRAVFAMSSVVAAEQSSKCEGYNLHLPTIIDCYTKIGTIIHPAILKPEIDVNALQYACSRLPANITETFVINLARSLPPFLASELRNRQHDSVTPLCRSFSSDPCNSGDGSMLANVTYVPTANRRRSSWRIGDKGHTLVLMRDGLTDVVDFMTSLSIHLVESRKIRVRLQSMITPSAADVLRDAMVAIRGASGTDEVEELQQHVLGQLPFTNSERSGLSAMWPHTAVQKLYNIIMHQEQYIVKVDTSLSKRFATDNYLPWGLIVRSNIYKMLGLSESEPLPQSVEINILSSRNRSTKNLLCSMVETHMPDILNLYERSDDMKQIQWYNESDKWYYALFRLINERDDLRIEYKNILKSCGFALFEDHTTSGLQVDLIDLSMVKPELSDPYLKATLNEAKKSTVRKFLVNIDFTFGAQAEGIMRALFLTFGHHIRSVNVVGKCAGISGSKGDILLPKKLLFSKASFGEDTTDEMRDCGNKDLSVEGIRELVADTRKIFTGPCITIPGMILQNEVLIKFYKVVYNCDGMEMEGSYVARQVEECANLGLIRPDINTRYFFYMSDMPIGNEDGSKTSAKSKSAETIMSMYAGLRGTVRAILSQ